MPRVKRVNLLIGAFEPRRAFFLVTVLKHSPSAIPLSKSTLPCFYDRTRALMKCVRILYSAAVLRRFPFGSCGGTFCSCVRPRRPKGETRSTDAFTRWMRSARRSPPGAPSFSCVE